MAMGKADWKDISFMHAVSTSDSWNILGVRHLRVMALCRRQDGFYVGEAVVVRALEKEEKLLCY